MAPCGRLGDSSWVVADRFSGSGRGRRGISCIGDARRFLDESECADGGRDDGPGGVTLSVGSDETPDDEPALCAEHELFVGDGVETLVAVLLPLKFSDVSSGWVA